jgi:DNA-binding transcriptional regulator YiaG
MNVAKTPPKTWTAKRVRELRDHLGLTQKQAAAWVRVSQQLWADWESGRRKPVLPMRLLLDLLEAGRLPPPDAP